MSGSSFKLLPGCLIFLILLAIARGAAPDEDAVKTFVGSLFAGSAPEPVTVPVTEEYAKLATELLGHPYPRATTQYWSAPEKTLWVIAGRGKTGVFTAGFVLREQRITEVRVLAYHEHRGHAVKSKRFTRQFLGLSLTPSRKLSKTIHAVTGATISSKAMVNMARLALAWDAMEAAEREDSGEQ